MSPGRGPSRSSDHCSLIALRVSSGFGKEFPLVAFHRVVNGIGEPAFNGAACISGCISFGDLAPVIVLSSLLSRIWQVAMMCSTQLRVRLLRPVSRVRATCRPPRERSDSPANPRGLRVYLLASLAQPVDVGGDPSVCAWTTGACSPHPPL
jgi:hypothetical protein